MLSWLEVPLIVGLLVVLSTGVAMLLSALFVYFRDIQPIWDVLSQVIFYASPIIIPVALVQEHLSRALLKIYMLNPLAVIFQQFRHAFITHDTPSAAALLGSNGRTADTDRDGAGYVRDRLPGVQPSRSTRRRGSLTPAWVRNDVGGGPILRGRAISNMNCSSRVDPLGPVVTANGRQARLTQSRAEARVGEQPADRRRDRGGVGAGIRQFSPSTQKSRLPWASVQTTAQPVAIASRIGRQKPSCAEVCTNTVASLSSSLTSASDGLTM